VSKSDLSLAPASRSVGLIDVHSHFVTNRYVEAARAAGHTRPDGMGGWPHWSIGSHLGLMDTHGISMSVLSISSPGTHFGDDARGRILSREINEYGAAVARDHPRRFGHFASLPLPDVGGSLIELAYALDVLGSDGVTVETNAHGTYLGNPSLEPLWAELDHRGAVVFVHPTSPACWEAVSLQRPRPMLEFIFDTTRTVSDLIFSGVFSRYPAIEWIFTHGGGALPLLADRIELFRKVFLGGEGEDEPVLEQLRRVWFDMAGTPFPRQVPALVAAVGCDRLLYGSDYCFTPMAAVAAQIASMEQGPQPANDTWRALSTRNAGRLLTRVGERLTIG
jgi:predicted TIM-barrel fold metal-dependent hydrolase